MAMSVQTEKLRDNAVAYYDLCAKAHQLGVKVSVSDSRTPEGMRELRKRVDDAEFIGSLGTFANPN
jgi:uroporphyrinogen-III decarboxylase